jgi:hypothetical protein
MHNRGLTSHFPVGLAAVPEHLPWCPQGSAPRDAWQVALTSTHTLHISQGFSTLGGWEADSARVVCGSLAQLHPNSSQRQIAVKSIEQLVASTIPKGGGWIHITGTCIRARLSGCCSGHGRTATYIAGCFLGLFIDIKKQGVPHDHHFRCTCAQ